MFEREANRNNFHALSLCYMSGNELGTWHTYKYTYLASKYYLQYTDTKKKKVVTLPRIPQL